MLRLSAEIFHHIVAHCQQGYPFECCGILLGRSEGEGAMVHEALPAQNLNEDRAHDRYELNPADFHRADALARENDLEIIGFYHSHPDHPPVASATDTERAWEGYSYLIVSLRNGKLDSFKSWRLERGAMFEEPVEVTDG